MAFVISWGFVLALTGPANIPIDPEESADLLPFLYVSMLFGPAIGGILMTSLAGGKAAWKELFARLGKWRVNIRWYAAALLLTPVLAIL
ncbi:hypothetical protein RZS08_57250, partial [Arthrospira platensis SPKY1]|nr:hypothetical protein [Arthrospira platensis SPKY1]